MLVAEDDAGMRLATASLLRGTFRVQLRLAEDGLIAFDEAVSGEWDIVLMDIQMPVLDGLEASRRIREFEGNNPGRKRVPIVAYTACRPSSIAALAASAGIDDILHKPAEPLTLAEMIFKWTRTWPFAHSHR